MFYYFKAFRRSFFVQKVDKEQYRLGWHKSSEGDIFMEVGHYHFVISPELQALEGDDENNRGTRRDSTSKEA